MPGTLVIAAIATLSLVHRTDTTFAAAGANRVMLDNRAGDVRVTTWDRDQVRIATDLSTRDYLDISRSGSVIKVRTRYDGEQSVDYEVTLPRRMSFSLTAVEGDVTLDGLGGEVNVQTVTGDVSVRGGVGFITVQTVDGEIDISDARATISAKSGADDITISNSSGDIQVQGIDGDIRLESVDSNNMQVSTIAGDIDFDGTIRDGGQYRLSTHDGDITLLVPRGANATFVVATADGDFLTDFPITVEDTQGRQRMSFTVGTGRAQCSVETFDGDIHLQRR